jgi:hypothetical protein
MGFAQADPSLRVRQQELSWREFDAQTLILDERSWQYMTVEANEVILWRTLVEGLQRANWPRYSPRHTESGSTARAPMSPHSFQCSSAATRREGSDFGWRPGLNPWFGSAAVSGAEALPILAPSIAASGRGELW